MADVYAATHTNGRRVAIKVLRDDLARRKEICERFLLEGYAANKVNHPGAIAILDNDVAEDGAPFLVMERLEGETLQKRIGKERLDEDEVVRIAVDVLDVLVAAHAQGIVHRDVKPENLFLTEGRVKVLDFGIARVRDLTVRTETKTGSSMGTPAYMSPEQARGESSRIDERTDVFAVGATMITAMTGRPIHETDGAHDPLFSAMTKPVPAALKVIPGIHAGLARVIDRAVAFERDARWDSAAAMRDALLSYKTLPEKSTFSFARAMALAGVSIACAAGALFGWQRMHTRRLPTVAGNAARPSEAVARCARGGPGRMLACSSNCPDSLFQSIVIQDDFHTDSPYAALWAGTHVVPSLTPEGLQFGPHPLSTSWPETYSQTLTKNAGLGDVLFCVRFRTQVGANPAGAEQANDFHIAIRGGIGGAQEGMGVIYKGKRQRLVLATKEAADFWQEHASTPLVLAEGDHFIEVAIYGEGNDFFSETKDIATGEIHALHASYAVPALGTAAMIGWQLSKPLLVTRIAVGTPTSDTRPRIMAP
jgi:serine/threonine protein kinase